MQRAKARESNCWESLPLYILCSPKKEQHEKRNSSTSFCFQKACDDWEKYLSLIRDRRIMSSEKLRALPGLTDTSTMNLEETELTLGLPGGESRGKSGNKRAFLETVDLNLGRSDGEGQAVVDSEVSDRRSENGASAAPPKVAAAKTQVVGWPPLKSSRKKAMMFQSRKYVKVAADGAPYLRKVDLEIYSSYDQLLAALGEMFSCFSIRNYSSGRKLMNTTNGVEYVATYEDKDGDWMLVGDVPWKMFVETCKRLRLMKSSEAMGLAPRTPDLTSTSSS